jgi:hypothetical protein
MEQARAGRIIDINLQARACSNSAGAKQRRRSDIYEQQRRFLLMSFPHAGSITTFANLSLSLFLSLSLSLSLGWGLSSCSSRRGVAATRGIIPRSGKETPRITIMLSREIFGPSGIRMTASGTANVCFVYPVETHVCSRSRAPRPCLSDY